MKYIIIETQNITQDVLDLLNGDAFTQPTLIYQTEPDFEQNEPGVKSIYSYVSTNEEYPVGFAGYKKLTQEEFDSAVAEIVSSGYFKTRINEKVEIAQEDPETGGLQTSPKYAPKGWSQQLFETEFETSKLNSIHEKDINNNDIGWSSLKFYNASGTELTTQNDIDTNCVMTILDWMPDQDYMILSGEVGQLTVPVNSIYAWVVAAPDIPAEMGGSVVFCEGGLNLSYVPAPGKIGLSGVSGTRLNYNGGIGSNKIRFIFRHPAGVKHKFQAILNIFRAP